MITNAMAIIFELRRAGTVLIVALLWTSGIVMVAAAGSSYHGALNAPATGKGADSPAAYSARDTGEDGISLWRWTQTTANQGEPAGKLIQKLENHGMPAMGNVNWGKVKEDKVNWSSIRWDS